MSYLRWQLALRPFVHPKQLSALYALCVDVLVAPYIGLEAFAVTNVEVSDVSGMCLAILVIASCSMCPAGHTAVISGCALLHAFTGM